MLWEFWPHYLHPPSFEVGIKLPFQLYCLFVSLFVQICCLVWKSVRKKVKQGVMVSRGGDSLQIFLSLIMKTFLLQLKLSMTSICRGWVHYKVFVEVKLLSQRFRFKVGHHFYPKCFECSTSSF